MQVLSFIGIIIGMMLIYIFVIKVNDYTEKTFKYEFFNIENYGVSALGYVGIYYGYKWYQNAVVANGDLLNGTIVLTLGAIMVLGVVVYNTRKTSIKTSLLVSPVQLVLYAALSVVGLIALLAMIGYFLQTKPVYDVSGR